MQPRRIDHDAARAAEEALAGIGDGKPLSAQVLTRLKGLPALLRASGVPATLAFMEAKSGGDELGRAYRKVSSALMNQLRQELGWSGIPAKIHTSLADVPTADLGRAYLRLAAFAGWLRRLAEAEENAQREEAERKKAEQGGVARTRVEGSEIADG